MWRWCVDGAEVAVAVVKRVEVQTLVIKEHTR
jgi:hypothetical protein